MSLIIRIAAKDDLKQIKKLLQRSRLNQKGLEENISNFLVAEDSSNDSVRIVAVAGLEKKGIYGYLRSLVMQSQSWNAIIGLDFINLFLRFAKQKGCKELYLLTNPSGQLFFEYLHFHVIDLDDTPTEIKAFAHFKESYNDHVVIMKTY